MVRIKLMTRNKMFIEKFRLFDECPCLYTGRASLVNTSRNKYVGIWCTIVLSAIGCHTSPLLFISVSLAPEFFIALQVLDIRLRRTCFTIYSSFFLFPLSLFFYHLYDSKVCTVTSCTYHCRTTHELSFLTVLTLKIVREDNVFFFLFYISECIALTFPMKSLI